MDNIIKVIKAYKYYGITTDQFLLSFIRELVSSEDQTKTANWLMDKLYQPDEGDGW